MTSFMQVGVLKSPNAAQIDQMVSLIADAFEQEPLINAMTGGIPQLRADLFRLTIRAAALEGVIFVVQDPPSEEIFSVGICFGPGVDFLGSKAQWELGAEQFFTSLPNETKQWLEKYYKPTTKEFIEDTIGQEKLTANWFVSVIATLKTEQGKGHGILLMKEICQTVAEDKSSVVLNTTSKRNVDFFHSFGLKAAGSTERSSPFGNWINTLMMWNSVDNSNLGHVVRH